MDGVRSLVRAALPAVPVVNLLPGIRKTGEPLAGLAHERTAEVRREHVDRYAETSAVRQALSRAGYAHG